MAPVSHNRGRRSGRTALATAGTVVVLALTGCSALSGLLPGGEEEPSPEPTETVDAAPLMEEALADLAAYPALTATGQVAESVGGQVQDTALTVADSGATSGTVQVNGAEGELISVDGRTYVRAAEDFWLDRGVFGPDFDDFEGNWVRTSAGQTGIDPATTLAPAELAAILGELEIEEADAVEENLDGTLTYRVDLAGERDQVWIDAETNQIQRIAIEELVPEDAETGPQVRLDLAQAEQSETEQLYDGLITAVEEELTSSRDARVEVAWQGDPALTCEDGPDCTWSGTVADSGDAEGGSVAVRMDVTFSEEELGQLECSDGGTLEAGGTLELSCGADYDNVSTSEQERSVDGEARLSTRGMSGDDQEAVLTALREQREATLAGEGAAADGTDAEESPAENGSGN
ncbi:hypothetical protein BJF83_03450 [Nocardiopsis sp. CNR-923]|uniref:hypothetical protein n=1 Tax=Nocardiopsis sp. CNR-923 TaxID=1904965 RepID=UPI00095CFC71|nr:hypothetical protein [Nocardiopsis sp. CNR-923]OLT26769.1 hypothetical protein BJF83_03450 [Nocardiopsis sp. CNR-923]